MRRAFTIICILSLLVAILLPALSRSQAQTTELWLLQVATYAPGTDIGDVFLHGDEVLVELRSGVEVRP